ncbi:hypothetical protein OfM1_03710 [Lactovum odontotermitis]
MARLEIMSARESDYNILIRVVQLERIRALISAVPCGYVIIISNERFTKKAEKGLRD